MKKQKQLNVLITLDEYIKLKDELLRLSIIFDKKITFTHIIKQLIENSLTAKSLYDLGIITYSEFQTVSNLTLMKEKNKQYKRLKKLNDQSYKQTRLKPEFLQPKKTDKLFSDRLKSFMLDEEKQKYQEYLDYKNKELA